MNVTRVDSCIIGQNGGRDSDCSDKALCFPLSHCFLNKVSNLAFLLTYSECSTHTDILTTCTPNAFVPHRLRWMASRNTALKRAAVLSVCLPVSYTQDIRVKTHFSMYKAAFVPTLQDKHDNCARTIISA